MRNTIALLVVGIALLGAKQAVASERDDALEILGKAIKAHGGEDALAKAAQLNRKGVGTITIFDKELSIADDLTVALPDRMRLILEVTQDKQKVSLTQVVNGNVGWQDNGGAVMELTNERLTELQEEAYVQWISLLIPLMKDKEFNIKPLQPTKINSRQVVGVKVARKSRPDISFYFDAESNLLVKIQRRTKQAGVEVQKDTSLGDYKEVDGVKLPFQIVEMLNDKKFAEVKIVSYKLLSKLDDKLFGKP
jgi:hypothetical protein